MSRVMSDPTTRRRSNDKSGTRRNETKAVVITPTGRPPEPTRALLAADSDRGHAHEGRTIVRQSPIPYHHQLFEILRDAIRGGIWPPGAMIPSEAQLAETYGISRTVIRSAVQRLIVDRLVQRIKGKGIVVGASGTDQEAFAIAGERDMEGRDRDLAADVRDREAERRDREAEARDDAASDLDRTAGDRAASDRQHAADEGARAASRRAGAADNRAQAINDRKVAANDRALAINDRKVAADDRAQAYLALTDRRVVQLHLEAANAGLEKSVAARNAELEASNRELKAFSYSVSHDLRAPLRAIDGFSRLLLEENGAELSAEAAHRLQVVRDGAQQMGFLIDDLLTFSRIGRLELKK